MRTHPTRALRGPGSLTGGPVRCPAARPLRRVAATGIALGLALLHALAHAAPPGDSPGARAAFVEGTALARDAKWAEALAAFERAAQLKPHAVATYNIGFCERALGRYTRARARFAAALEENDRAGRRQLPASLVADSTAFLREIDGLLARVRFTVRPAGAALAVDGRPVHAVGGDGVPTFIAGVRPPGPAAAVPAASYVLILDPGVHVLTFARKGFADAVVNRSFAPGAQVAVTIELDRLPAALHISSDREGALVLVNDADLGPAPLDLLRPAGKYRVVVRKGGFVPYEAQITARPGEEVELRATLAPKTPSLFKRWWFWTGVGVIAAGVATGTYAATRPAPVRPPVTGGTLDWRLDLR
ncbi:MAG TPA: PEGA domain-containing protein [Polyangia bacterium]|jgi:hypothetical protein